MEIINNSFPLSKSLLPGTASGQIELIEMQEDETLLHKPINPINKF